MGSLVPKAIARRAASQTRAPSCRSYCEALDRPLPAAPHKCKRTISLSQLQRAATDQYLMATCMNLKELTRRPRRAPMQPSLPGEEIPLECDTCLWDSRGLLCEPRTQTCQSPPSSNRLLPLSFFPPPTTTTFATLFSENLSAGIANVGTQTRLAAAAEVFLPLSARVPSPEPRNQMYPRVSSKFPV